MKKSLLLTAAAAALLALPALADTAARGGLSSEQIGRIKSAYQHTPADKALHNALAGTDINVLALNAEKKNNFDTHFSHRVPSKGITNQRSSGRCWLFTGLNVLRAQMMEQHDLPMLELSQSYGFFWDQLEKANLFLQGIIDTASLPEDDRKVDWLFEHPISDGGKWIPTVEQRIRSLESTTPEKLSNNENPKRNICRVAWEGKIDKIS